MTFFGEDAGDENARRGFFKQFADFVGEWKVHYHPIACLTRDTVTNRTH
jgi:hypothetical protein